MYFLPNLSLTDRFAQIIGGLQRGLAKRTIAPTGIAWALVNLVWSRLFGLQRRFAALAERMRTGTLPKPRPPRQQPRPATPRPPAAPDAPRLPAQSSGWLIRLAPEPWHLNYWRGPLQELLADPELLAMVQAAPQAARILRSLCRMLHEPLPPFLQLPPRPRRPRPKAPAKPKPPKFVDISRVSAVAWGHIVHPEYPGQQHPPNRLGYARARPPPKKSR